MLYSGGLDSLGALLLLIKEWSVDLLTVDYGQRAAAEELRVSAITAARYGLKLKTLEMPWYRDCSCKSPMILDGSALPYPDSLDDKTVTQDSARSVWLPNRNGLLLNICAFFAEVSGTNHIAAGFNAEEGLTFPDNSKEFVVAADNFFSFSTLNGVKVLAPVINMDKTEIAGIILQHQAENLFYSCYQGNKLMCGRCESCRRAKRAFFRSGGLERVRGMFHESSCS